MDTPQRPLPPLPPLSLSPAGNASHSVCVRFLYSAIGNSDVHWFDLALLFPSTAFLLFLLVRLRRVRERLQRNWSPIFSAFYFLVFGATVISALRCVLAMCLPPASVAQKVAWLITRFSLLFVEASFIVFALIGSQLENSSKSVLCVVMVTLGVTATYSGVQSVLELGHFYNDTMYVDTNQYDVYEHGGMLFWFVSSTVLAVTYGVILVLGCVPRERLCITLPRRATFYWYVVAMGTLNVVQALGSALLYFPHLPAAQCIVELTSLLYFALFAPLIYLVFLRGFFKSRAAIALTSLAQRSSMSRAAATNSDVSMNGRAALNYRRVRDDDRDVAFVNASLNDDAMIFAEAEPDRVSLCDDDQLLPFDPNFYTSSEPPLRQSAPNRPPSVEIVEPVAASRNGSRVFLPQQADFFSARSPHSDSK